MHHTLIFTKFTGINNVTANNTLLECFGVLVIGNFGTNHQIIKNKFA